MRQLLHREYLQSQLQAWPWKQLLKGAAAESDRRHPCSPFFAHGSTPLLAREEGVWRVGEHCLLGLAWSLLSHFAPVPPAAARLPLLSSAQCSVRAALLRSFELASDAIMTVFIRLPHSCLNLFLSWGLKWQALWSRDVVLITVYPLCLARCLAKYAGTLRYCCGLNAQQFLQYFHCWPLYVDTALSSSLAPKKHSEI